MVDQSGGEGQFRAVTLRPEVTVREAGMLARAEELHEQANAKCFIARSVNFPVHHKVTTRVATG